MTPATYATLVQLAVFPEIFIFSAGDKRIQLWRLVMALGRHATKYAELSQCFWHRADAYVASR